MDVLNYNFEVDNFEIKGTMKGKCSIYPNYAYTILPPIDDTPCIFKMTLSQELVGDNSGKITYKTHSDTEIDNKGVVPSVDLLYQLVLNTCKSSSEELGKLIIINTDLRPILIPPPTLDQCKDVLQGVITRAFPVN